MPTVKDNNNVVLFSDPFKVYLFKDIQQVKISFKITDYVVLGREFKQEDFEYILEHWNVGEGVQGEVRDVDNTKYWWYHSKFGPRPECEPADFVGINFNRHSFRFSLQEMESLKTAYFHQKDNKMHWD
tara:strand:- start:59 stop:442 length:384 start_codon:yes stop_codon:yes gene_type:complete